MNATLSEQLAWRYNIQPKPELKVTASDSEPFIFYSHHPRHHDDNDLVCDGINHYSIVTPLIYICDEAFESLGEMEVIDCSPCDGSCREPQPESDFGQGCNREAGKDFVHLINNYLAENQNGGTCHE